MTPLDTASADLGTLEQQRRASTRCIRVYDPSAQSPGTPRPPMPPRPAPSPLSPSRLERFLSILAGL